MLGDKGLSHLEEVKGRDDLLASESHLGQDSRAEGRNLYIPGDSEMLRLRGQTAQDSGKGQRPLMSSRA